MFPAVEPVANTAEDLVSMRTCVLPAATVNPKVREVLLTKTIVESSATFTDGLNARLTFPVAPQTAGEGRVIVNVCCSMLENWAASKLKAGVGSGGVMPIPLSG